MKSIAVVDADIMTYDILSGYIKNLFPFDDLKIDDYSDSIEFCDAISDNIIYDMAFIDVSTPDYSGLEAADMLRKSGKHTLLIFMSYCTDNLIPLFEFMPSGFLKKPLESSRFNKLMKKIAGYMAADSSAYDCTIIRNGKNNVRIAVRDIVYARINNGRNVIITMSDGSTVSTYEKLSDLYERLSRISGSIVRIHKSFFININHISEFTARTIKMDNEAFLPISTPYSSSVRGFLNNRFIQNGTAAHSE